MFTNKLHNTRLADHHAKAWFQRTNILIVISRQNSKNMIGVSQYDCDAFNLMDIVTISSDAHTERLSWENNRYILSSR